MSLSPGISRKEWLFLLVIAGIALLIYYPVIYSQYTYTDEVVQLWHYRPGSSYHMFSQQGRMLTEELFSFLFGRINTIDGLTSLRLFSFAGWLICLPIWFVILKKGCEHAQLSPLLPLMGVLYLVCCPSFSISIGWASVLELFIANTAGLLSGYLFFSLLTRSRENIIRSALVGFSSILCGLVALFTYQHGFGCFLIPFVLLALGKQTKLRLIVGGIAAFLIIAGIYFLLFRWYAHVQHMETSSRAGIGFDLFHKIKFFFFRPLVSAYHYTWLVNEKSKAGIIVSVLLGLITVWLYWKKLAGQTTLDRIKRLILFVVVLMLIYLPSLVVQESYSSNRTLLGLCLAVYLLSFEMAFLRISNTESRKTWATVLAFCLLLNASYNFRFEFLKPAVKEYAVLRNAITTTVRPGTRGVFFIRPEEDMLSKQKKIVRSWDEFGVPSSFFNWVPEFLVKQVCLENGFTRSAADSLQIESNLRSIAPGWPPVSADSSFVVIDAPALLRER